MRPSRTPPYRLRAKLMLATQEQAVDVTSVKWRSESGDETIYSRSCSSWQLAHMGGQAVMRTFKIIVGIGALVLALMAGWQITSWELVNINFQDELQDMGSLAGAHMGVVVPLSDEEMVGAVIHKAEEHGIQLRSDQITVQRIGSGEKSTMYIAADYRVPVRLLFLSFSLHFTPTSRR